MASTALMQRSVARSAKIVIAGGFGAGKTAFVEAASDIAPITTDAPMATDAGTQDIPQVPTKRATTAALDFGRADLEGISLYLFGTPGQPRFWFMWDRIVLGALGAVVLADTRRLADCFGAIDYFEHLSLPYIVVINRFAGVAEASPAILREALAIGPEVPVLICDARVCDSAKRALVQLVEHLIQVRSAGHAVAELLAGNELATVGG